MPSRRLGLYFFLSTLLLALALLLIREASLQPDGKAHISFLDVGQGDSIFIVTPSGKQILIDGGPDLSTLKHLGTHMPFFDRSIDLLVLTHSHQDHLASFPEILRRYTVGGLLTAATEDDLPRYQEIFSMTRRFQVPIMKPSVGEKIEFDDGFSLTVVWPPDTIFGTHVDHEHDATVAVRVDYKDHSALLTGDLEMEYEKEIMEMGTDIDVDILKVGHHGSNTSTSTGFLLATSPELAVISVGKDNSYGHPTSKTLSRLQHFGVPVKRTDRDGTVEIEWE